MARAQPLAPHHLNWTPTQTSLQELKVFLPHSGIRFMPSVI